MYESECQPTGRIVGLCYPVMDTLVNCDMSNPPAGFSLPDGVEFHGAAEFEKYRAKVHRFFSESIYFGGGGPVSNTLFAAGMSLGSYPRSLRLEWSGPIGFGAVDSVIGDPLSALRAAGVTINGYWSDDWKFSESICFVDSVSGETQGIVVGPRDVGTRSLPALEVDDVLLLTVSEVADVCDLLEGLPRFAVVLADVTSLSERNAAALRYIAVHGRLDFLMGKIGEFRSLDLVKSVEDGAIECIEWLRDTELVATNSGEPVQIFERGSVTAGWTLPTGDISSTTRRSLLGAGDAYAGAYLASRLSGSSIGDAHHAGQLEARLASYSITARRKADLQLETVFGKLISRRSEGPEWHLFERLRVGCGLMVISCGNTGVDTAALEAAQELGLMSMAVMPQGRRNDINDDGLSPAGVSWPVFELGTPSYRYTTWANVYLSDATILIDISGGEGSEETRRAARALGRPLLEISRTSERAEIRGFIRRHGVRVLNVAGSRVRGIDARAWGEWRDVVKAAVWDAASAWSSKWLSHQNQNREGLGGVKDSRPLRLAVPNIPEERSLLHGFLLEEEFEVVGPLAMKGPQFDVIFGKSRDLLSFLKAGAVDFALVGKDIFLEEGLGDCQLVGEFRLFNCLVGLIEPPDSLTPSLVVSQYPKLAQSYLHGGAASIIPIHGAAEGWVASGAADACVDTWRTGLTAADHGLRLSESIAGTGLCLLVRGGAGHQVYQEAHRLWRYLIHSPAGEVE